MIMGLSRGVSGALLATDVLAVGAKLVGTERSLAAVAGTANSHTDRFGHTLDGYIDGRSPFSGLKGQPILGEQSASFFLLDGAPMLKNGWLNSMMGGSFLRWSGVGLGNSSRSFGRGRGFRRCGLGWFRPSTSSLLQVGPRFGPRSRALSQHHSHTMEILRESFLFPIVGLFRAPLTRHDAWGFLRAVFNDALYLGQSFGFARILI